MTLRDFGELLIREHTSAPVDKNRRGTKLDRDGQRAGSINPHRRILTNHSY
jgi:hypothetical protein